MEAVKRVFSLSRARGPALPSFLLVLLGGAFLAVDAFAEETIVAGEAISGNQTLVSKNGEFELGFFAPGAGIHRFLGVRFKKMPTTSPTFWVGDRIPITDLSAAALEVFRGGLCIKEAGAILWCSSGAGDGSLPPATATAVLLDTGNLVVRDQANSSRILWESFDCPGDSLLPGARLGFDRDTGSNISMTYMSYPHNGSISVDQSRRNGFVLTTDGHDSLGTFPDWMVTSQDNGSSLMLNRPSPNVTEFLQLNLGQVSLVQWSEDSAAANSSGWVANWTFPSDCKSGAFFCGDFGACTSNGKCKCVDGFEPSYPAEWGLGSFATGCSRSLPLSCQTNGQTEHDDSFILIEKLQGLPYNSQNDSAQSDEDCKQACFTQCNCVAYVYDSGCKLWYNNLYSMSFASKPPYSKVYVRWGSKLRAKNGIHTRTIVLLVAGVIAMTSVVLILVLLWRHRRDLFTCRKFEVEGSLVFYSYRQIKKATSNFSDKLGEGGFGSVFRGTMPGPGSTVVAVKSLKGRGHADKQFRAEVQTVGVVKHTNLVRLLGFCVKGDMRLLVYEYMPNGSLDSHLFSERSSLLNWDLRYQIALGIAKGLAYLHEECEDCIIHCDIKPENILLDEEFCAKIADFGMAKLLGREFNSALTTIRGTMGYLAPEWIYGQPITKKTDVYSFGIVLLEIISGRRTIKRLKFGSHRYFPLYAAAQVNEGDVLCLLDSRLEGNANVKELEITCRVACWCIQDEENNRPSMGQVVHMLEGVVNTEIPPIPSSFQNLMEGENSAIYSDEG
ncbi:G-type lectin S-receptor-like serine/threonine-protein kinase [Dichanthelium oligosanthes]|uniref:Receptor-like serine/threonine-protein kinase n=1 Tax=Dichanthelium oligosanthes TaxID=888268 RepID=A0A1E5VYJ8_9POAL|nr:G-type lectin S-receptor-like serine/threonine-protein kinase [Dichanthelium oligosanthes]